MPGLRLSIVRLTAGAYVARWRLANAWIPKIVSPDLNAAASDVATDTL